MKPRATVLICDDDSSFVLAAKQCLKNLYECKTAKNGDEALAIIRCQSIDILLLDIQMRTENEGIDFLPRFLEADRELSVVMNSARTDFEAVREAMRLGATDYIPKNSNPEELLHALARVDERRRLLLVRGQQTFEARAAQGKHALIGNSRAIQELKTLIGKVQQSNLNVVITGETGTGKEVVARNLRATRDDGTLEPFVAVDSSTIQSSLAEGMLFGFEKGAFTGADKTTKGVFEEANVGTVYFDELANMPLGIQAKLLRVLQEKEVTRLGSTRVIPLEFRVIAATNRDLTRMIGDGSFRDDLFQRLNVVQVEVPPLRSRVEDLPVLIGHLTRLHARAGKPALRFHADAVAFLQTHTWPGNVRELSNLVAYLAATTEGDEIDVPDLPPKFRDAIRPLSTDGSFYGRIGSFEKSILSEELTKHEGNISQLAITLKMDRSHLYTKLREHGLHATKTDRKTP